MTRPKYRVHVWKDRQAIGDHYWNVGVWADRGQVIFRPNTPVSFPTHAEAVAAGLAWAGELNAQEKEATS